MSRILGKKLLLGWQNSCKTCYATSMFFKTREIVMQYCFTYIDTELGKILLVSDGKVLTGLYFDKQKHIPTIDSCGQRNAQIPLFSLVEKQLTEYFHGKRQEFEVPHAITAGTDCQQKVWTALAKIPYGTILSYRQLAERVGTPQSIRAVANAVGRNPISLIIPCHRIIASNGSLCGYAGGLGRKQALLGTEKDYYELQ